ncbi:hypothetical protein FLONG3_9107 [Fusarium longipes]|uniref:Uncharacterized protein n=1 Tax=Fusarium longipes TaxID=694270 RepID=A0A395S066_9HYPO|nr:hypothetical protein FLONG3_9107 [Fusarium longipes]
MTTAAPAEDITSEYTSTVTTPTTPVAPAEEVSMTNADVVSSGDSAPKTHAPVEYQQPPRDVKFTINMGNGTEQPNRFQDAFLRGVHGAQSNTGSRCLAPRSTELTAEQEFPTKMKAQSQGKKGDGSEACGP